jgi:spore germination protein GerM
VVPVLRPTSANTVTDRLTAALDGLLAGPTSEEQAVGLRSWFSSETAESLNGVQVDDTGRAIVDFADFSNAIPNASTAAGRRQLLAELRNTIFQFEEVETVELWFDGSCHAFWEWLQTTCTPLTRGDG